LIEKRGALMLFDPITQRVPPHNLDAEVSCLGACLIDPEALATVLAQLREADLYLSAHQTILAAIRRVASRGDRPDLVTLAAELERTHRLEEVGGGAYLAELVDRTFTAAAVSQHIRIVKEHAGRRRIIQACTRTVGAMYDGEQHPAEAAAHLAEDLDAAGACTDGRIVPSRITDTLKTWMATSDSAIRPVRIPTHITKLNRCLGGGFALGRLAYLGARPSVGKTSLALDFARHAAPQGFGVLVVSLEMPEVDGITTRALAQESRVSELSIRSGLLTDFEYPRMVAGYGALATLPLWLTEKAYHLDVITDCADHWPFTPRLSLLIVDYLQLVKGPKSESRRLEVEAISRGLKLLSVRANVSVLCISSLKNTEGGEDREPHTSDLKETGNLEYDADLVLLLHRKFNATDATLIIGKNKYGPVGKFPLEFNRECVTFTEAAGENNG